MSGRSWWARTGSRRNPLHCCCMLAELGHVVMTERPRRVLGATNQAAHFTGCKHSELGVTTMEIDDGMARAIRTLRQMLMVERTRVSLGRRRDRATKAARQAARRAGGSA